MVDNTVWVAVVSGIFALSVAWITNARGKATANDSKPFEPNENHGEHAHTRQVLLSRFDAVDDKLDDIEDLIKEKKHDQQP